MMSTGYKNILKYISSVIIGIIIGILINIPSCQKESGSEVIYKEVHDTVTIDSVRIQWKTKPVEVYLIDTFYVKESGDTVKLDSLPIEKKVYKDTIINDSTSTEIQVNFHGFDAGIDSIWLRHNYFEKETTIVKQPKKVGLVWAIGLGAGFGGHASINGETFGYGPQIGIYGVVGIGNRIK